MLKSLYDKLDSQQQAAFKKQISRVPSGCEIVVNLDQKTSDEPARMMKEMAQQWLNELSLKKQAVVGLERLPSNYVLYIKGKFEDSQREQLKAFFLQYQADVNSSLPASISMRMQLSIRSGCFGDQQLAELT